MIKRFYITICLALVAIAANAQTITDELRRDVQGQGKVIINQSTDIDRLVNNVLQKKDSSKESNASNGTTQQPTTTNTPADRATTTEHPGTTEHPTPSERPTVSVAERYGASDSEATTVNTNKKIMRHSYKTTGYRIQVYSGGNKREDRQKCEQISARIKAKFPNLPIYVHFYSPSWKCRAGNFTDHSEAQAMLKQIRAMGYSQACLVKGTINVQY